jgi:hypothetical protein
MPYWERLLDFIFSLEPQLQFQEGCWHSALATSAATDGRSRRRRGVEADDTGARMRRAHHEGRAARCSAPRAIAAGDHTRRKPDACGSSRFVVVAAPWARRGPRDPAAKIGSSHYPLSPKPATTLSRKDWHSSANGAVVGPFRAPSVPWDPAPPAAWLMRGCGGGGERRRTNAMEDPDVKAHGYAERHFVLNFAAQ